MRLRGRTFASRAGSIMGWQCQDCNSCEVFYCGGKNVLLQMGNWD